MDAVPRPLVVGLRVSCLISCALTEKQQILLQTLIWTVHTENINKFQEDRVCIAQRAEAWMLPTLFIAHGAQHSSRSHKLYRSPPFRLGAGPLPLLGYAGVVQLDYC